ncbi:MAG: manganese-dependent inorganic pyrophosphatase [Coriobacteriales bacterium]|jgi:manganese-dependent inorganic pyrophosphatase
MSQILVVGHQNPDNDAIMSAYCFAALKNKLDSDNEYKPVRLGPLPAETQLVFDEFGITAPDLIDHVDEGTKLVLVDHNELGQAVPGIEGADIVEIVDHHRIADVTTAAPIAFINLPLGSTCTIVTKLYEYFGIEPDRGTAACLLAAALTDTVILKSPTATDIDREVVEKLAGIVGVDFTEFGMKLFKSRGGDDDVTAEEICKRDSKEFNFGGRKVWVAQYETVDLEGLRARTDEITAEVQKVQEDGGYDAALMLLTDIIQEGSDFIGAGDIGFIEDAFGISFADGPVWMPGVLSRKKQVAAKLIEYAG